MEKDMIIDGVNAGTVYTNQELVTLRDSGLQALVNLGKLTTDEKQEITDLINSKLGV